MASCNAYIIKETSLSTQGDWVLWFQWVRYNFDEMYDEFGYRFIYRCEGKLRATRAQARLPSVEAMQKLIGQAAAEGWADRDGDALGEAVQRLRDRGCVVTLKNHYIGFADSGAQDAQMIDDARLVRLWS